MEKGFTYTIWRRRPGFEPGHARIYVLMHGKQLAHPGKESEVQCSTLDRIPFAMKKRRLLEAYEPEPR